MFKPEQLNRQKVGENQPEKRTLLHSFRDAFRGVWDCLKSERNMRLHLAACCYVTYFSLRMGLGRGELACLFLTIGLVMAAEAMNTAVEKLCDFAEKRIDPRIGWIKDVAAGAVLLSALAAVLVGGALLLRPELLLCLKDLCTHPLSLALFLLSAAAAAIFIFAGPEKIGGWLHGKHRED